MRRNMAARNNGPCFDRTHVRMFNSYLPTSAYCVILCIVHYNSVPINQSINNMCLLSFASSAVLVLLNNIYNQPRYLRISVFPIMQLNSNATPLRICPHLGRSNPGYLKFLNWNVSTKKQVPRNDQFLFILY